MSEIIMMGEPVTGKTTMTNLPNMAQAPVVSSGRKTRSDAWRITNSSIPAVEAANALKSLENVAGYLGLSEEYKVRFATEHCMSIINYDTKTVTIQGADCIDKCPIEPEKFDRLVGRVIHEVMHDRIRSMESTEQVGIYAVNKNLPQDEQQELAYFAGICEDWLIDRKLQEIPALRDYVEANLLAAIEKKLESGWKPKPNSVKDNFLEYALFHNPNVMVEIVDEIIPAMQKIVELGKQLRPEQTAGCDYCARAALITRTWEEIKAIWMNPPQPPSKSEPQEGGESGDGDCSGENKEDTQPGKQKEDKEDKEKSTENPGESKESTDDEETGSGEEDGEDMGESEESPEESKESEEPSDSEGGKVNPDGKHKNKKEPKSEPERPLPPQQQDAPISKKMAEQIEQAIVEEIEDATEEIRKELEEAGVKETLPKILRRKERIGKILTPDRRLANKLEEVVKLRKGLQYRAVRGESEGDIDDLNLWRAGFKDKRVFKSGYKFPDGIPETVVLIDASGSMTEEQMRGVLMAAAAMGAVIKCQCWAYYYGGKVELIRLDENKVVRETKADGSTPSGLAILGVADTIKDKKRGLIIHLTDGGHNSGVNPRIVADLMKQKGYGVEVVNVIWGRGGYKYKHWGLPVEEINTIEDFPEALFKILKREAHIK